MAATRLSPSYARALAAARTFVRETEMVYLTRPPLLSGRLKSAQYLVEFMHQQYPTIAVEEQERFWSIIVNGKHQARYIHEVAIGTLASVDVHPREVFRELVLRAAAGVFFVHNHPSGDPEPSGDDLALTTRLRDCGRLLGIPVLDHVIVGGENYTSLCERGLL